MYSRLHQDHKNKKIKLEKRQRDMTPTFKPQVLNNYRSSKKSSMSSNLRESKSSNVIKADSNSRNHGGLNSGYSSRESFRITKRSNSKKYR